MSNVGDALSGGGSSASGISDTTLSDASLGDQITGGTGDFGTGDAAAFGDAGGSGDFNTFSNLANAFSGGSAGVGATPTAVQSASMTPPAAAGQTGGDPTGAAGGTQSNTAPGSSPDQNQQQQSGGGKQQDPNYAPPAAVSQLKALLKQLNSGKPAGPTGPTPTGGQAAPFALPTVAAGETGAQSPLRQLFSSQPAAASLPPVTPGETGAQSPQGAPPLEGGIPNLPGVAPGQTGPQSPQGADPGRPAVDANGNPVTAAGTPAADTPLPPARPGADQTADAGGGGGNITVRNNVGKRQIPDQDLPTKTGGLPLPTRKGGPTPAPATAGPATSSILRDISGVSTGSPTALADLAQAAQTILPLVLPLLGGLMGGGGRRGGRFHGGRFTHGFGGGFSGFRGGMNAMGHLHQGQHPMARGAWPYHHPVHGWHFHGSHPGQGWLPLNPTDAQGIVGGGQGQGGGQGGADPNNPPPETGGGDQPSDDTFQQSGYGSNPFVGALVGQESGGQNIVSKTDKDSQGRTLAQGGDPNQISQGYFQIQNHPGGTWATYARQAGVDLSHYPTPRSAPLDVQWNVASRIPIGQWGHDTKAMLHQRFGQFDERLTLEQVASRSGRASGRLADAMPQKSNVEPHWATNPSINGTGLPVASQPMVAGP